MCELGLGASKRLEIGISYESARGHTKCELINIIRKIQIITNIRGVKEN